MTKLNGKLLVVSAALVAVLSFTGTSAEMKDNCACSSSVDKRLPLSHPANRCQMDEVSHVSWFSWITGSHSSRQFHYLDLLELLTRGDSSPSTASDTTPGQAAL